MAAKIKGTFKADKAYAVGDSIEGEFEADQPSLDTLIQDRLKREKEATRLETQAKDALKKELDELKAKGSRTDPPADSDALKRVEALEAEVKREKLQNRILAQTKDLPAQFRDAIKLKADASDDDIAAAVKVQNEAFAELKKTLGAPETTPQNFGAAGSGASGSVGAQAVADKAAVEKVKAVPRLWGLLAHQSEATQVEMAKRFIAEGTLDKHLALTAKP